MDTPVQELSAGTLPHISATVHYAIHQEAAGLLKIVFSVSGTIPTSEIAIPLLPGRYAVPPEDIEQRVEDAVEDDDEEAWQTFLGIEPQFRTTNRWLAES